MKFAYIRIDTEKQSVETSGISFADFYHGIEDKPNYILVLKGYTSNSLYHRDLRLEYIAKEKIEPYLQSDLYEQGDFCWVDFKQEEHLDQLSNQELSELLFAAHKFEPFCQASFPSIHNKYIYCAHDDEYYTRVYMDVRNYMDVIEYVASRHLKQNGKISLPRDIKEQLFRLCKSGIIFDFEQNPDQIKFYTVSEKLQADDAWGKLSALRKQGNGWYLRKRNQEWILENECKDA